MNFGLELDKRLKKAAELLKPIMPDADNIETKTLKGQIAEQIIKEEIQKIFPGEIIEEQITLKVGKNNYVIDLKVLNLYIEVKANSIYYIDKKENYKKGFEKYNNIQKKCESMGCKYVILSFYNSSGKKDKEFINENLNNVYNLDDNEWQKFIKYVKGV